MKNVFITGASGFLGFAIIRYLDKLNLNLNIYALIRKNSLKDHLKSFKIQLIEGDLLSQETYRDSISKCDTVFHCAGQVGFVSKNKEDFIRNNYAGTVKIVNSTNREKLEHFVFTSSKGTRSSKIHQPNDEKTEFDFYQIMDSYMESKIKAEEFIKSKITEGFPASIMLPTGLIGWGDVKPTPMGQLIKDFLVKKIPLCPPGGIDLVDIDDVAKAHVDVVLKKKIGESYIVSGCFITFEELFKLISENTGIKGPSLKIPSPLFLGMAFIKEKVDTIFGRTPQVTLKKAISATSFLESSNKKIREELGFTPTDIRLTIQKTINYFNG
jgi:dihydroflavonol-4-reductase